MLIKFLRIVNVCSDKLSFANAEPDASVALNLNFHGFAVMSPDEKFLVCLKTKLLQVVQVDWFSSHQLLYVVLNIQR